MSKALTKNTIKARAWIRGENGLNQMLFSEDGKWHISYNPNTLDVGIFNGSSESETALCKDGQYFILNGDWRADYLKIVDKGFAACKRFFDAHQEHKSSWSN